MTVKELKEILDKLPDDVEIVFSPVRDVYENEDIFVKDTEYLDVFKEIILR